MVSHSNGLIPKDPHTKTQILTVGFEGDENLNLDDFELPGVDALPESEKGIAQAAFSRFQEFFKNPNKSKIIVNDEDLLDEAAKEDLKKLSTTTLPPPTTTFATTLPPTTLYPSRRPVYRPRTPGTTILPKTTRTRKIKRPGGFRRTTTTQIPTTTTEIPSGEATTVFPFTKYNGKKVEEFKPEQFQDYASVIRDLQSARPRVPSANNDGPEGSPSQLLGFSQVKDPRHRGPPIFEFGSGSTSKPKHRVVSAISTTTERQENTRGSAQIIDFSKPNGGFGKYGNNNDNNQQGQATQQAVKN